MSSELTEPGPVGYCTASQCAKIEWLSHFATAAILSLIGASGCETPNAEVRDEIDGLLFNLIAQCVADPAVAECQPGDKCEALVDGIKKDFGDRIGICPIPVFVADVLRVDGNIDTYGDLYK